MAARKRVPVKLYLDPKVRLGIKRKATTSGRSASDIANEALREVLVLDDRIKSIVRERRKELDRARPYEDVVAELERDGLL